jgi:TLD protein
VCSAPQATPPLVDAAAIQKINGWANLPSDTAWTLCYKATRDNVGFSFASTNSFAAAFHARCDGRARTFFVAKSTLGKLFGGYAGQPWVGGSLPAGTCKTPTDGTAFLFSLTNSFKHSLVNNNGYSAFQDCPDKGPVFGTGNDFATNLKDAASSSLGYTYVCRVGAGSPLCSTDYAGDKLPVLVELEVYSAP